MEQHMKEILKSIEQLSEVNGMTVESLHPVVWQVCGGRERVSAVYGLPSELPDSAPIRMIWAARDANPDSVSKFVKDHRDKLDNMCVYVCTAPDPLSSMEDIEGYKHCYRRISVKESLESTGSRKLQVGYLVKQ